MMLDARCDASLSYAPCVNPGFPSDSEQPIKEQAADRHSHHEDCTGKLRGWGSGCRTSDTRRRLAFR